MGIFRGYFVGIFLYFTASECGCRDLPTDLPTDLPMILIWFISVGIFRVVV